MNNKNKFKAIIAFAVALAFILPSSSVFANDISSEDEDNGTVPLTVFCPRQGTIILDGGNAPIGTTIEAQGAGVVLFSNNENPVTTTTVGSYGVGWDIKLMVKGDIVTGETISFLINDAYYADQTWAFAPNMSPATVDLTATSAATCYTLNIANVGSGTVDCNPVGDPPGTYEENEVVTLTPDPAVGYMFDSWSGDDVGDLTEVVPDTSWTIMMNEDKDLTATFVILTIVQVTSL